ncbi:hypothetical protein EV182_000880 [Spiromyces aspiralis]|uniref:Uncharacterized protein n=1 Tax=Spiromyces aspiralis TaxID=68401 RepID=A0ACC1HH15_9FUNG|nr:hypothetical protein EV182_000880 [Spiromyces aspiralis]
MGVFSDQTNSHFEGNIIWNHDGRPYAYVPLDLTRGRTIASIRHNGCCYVTGQTSNARPRNFLYRIFGSTKVPVNSCAPKDAVCLCPAQGQDPRCVQHNPCYSCGIHAVPPYSYNTHNPTALTAIPGEASTLNPSSVPTERPEGRTESSPLLNHGPAGSHACCPPQVAPTPAGAYSCRIASQCTYCHYYQANHHQYHVVNRAAQTDE